MKLTQPHSNGGPPRRTSFWRRADGAVAIIFALIAAGLTVLVVAGLDYSRATVTNQILQDSLDGAALFAARSDAVTDAELQELGMRSLTTNLANVQHGRLISASFTAGENGRTVEASARAEVGANILGVFADNKIVVNADAQIMRSSSDVEVALVLDTTGSMAGQKIADLRAAATELVNIVVQDQQTPFYSKVAIVPYAMAVNVGSAYAAQVRGPVNVKGMSGATRARPVVVTSANHGFSNGDPVRITGVNGMTELNNKEFVVANKTGDTFELKYYDSDGDLRNVDGRNYHAYTSGGLLHCFEYGCTYNRFTNVYGDTRTFTVSDCVSERTGADAYTDAAPATTLLGFNYPAAGNGCASSTITPLSSNKDQLRTQIGALTAGGSTGGHVGVAWGWYMLAPTFGPLWPQASRPADYDAENLIKAVVLMTDGEYNSSFCQGVISKNSTTGSGSPQDHINCNAPNGHAFDQALALCASMKQAGVLVYTVGLNVVNDPRATQLVTQCATSAGHVYLPTSGTALKDAFRDIAQNLSRLRIAR